MSQSGTFSCGSLDHFQCDCWFQIPQWTSCCVLWFVREGPYWAVFRTTLWYRCIVWTPVNVSSLAAIPLMTFEPVWEKTMMFSLWFYGRAEMVHSLSTQVQGLSVCLEWALLPDRGIIQVCGPTSVWATWVYGPLLLVLLLVHQPVTEESEVITHKELKWNRVLKAMKSVHCSHCLCF